MSDRIARRTGAGFPAIPARPGGRGAFRRTLALAAAVAAAAGACGGSSAPGVEREVRGDTVIVRTLGPGEWGGPGRLEEELRIGRLEGPEEEMFGPILTVAPDGRGGVYVFDGQVPALRHYDAEGRYTRTLGGKGAGPGEYQDVALALAVLDDGRVLMRDPRNARINIYGPDGEPLDTWPVASGLFTNRAMVVDTAGHVYLKILTRRPERNEPWPIALLHLDTTGAVVDTVPAPEIAGDPGTAGGTFVPGRVWEMSPTGDLVVGLTAVVDGTYRFEIRGRDGQVIRVEKRHEAVPVHPDERAELEARNDWMRRYRGQTMTAEIPPVPEVKPAYSGFYFGDGGRIWVLLHSPAEKGEAGEPRRMPGVEEPIPTVSWREPIVFDVFEPDGTYLGPVRVPPRTRLAAMRGDEVWAIQRGDMDEPYLVRYRLVTGPES